MKQATSVIPAEKIEKVIYMIRGQKVMLSSHLAVLYDVEPKVLMQSVKRNIDRFPEDFMFQLSAGEFENLKSQIVTSSWGGARRAKPYAFTEQGIAMLSSVLRSKRAIQVNIEIMRSFVKLREVLKTHKELACKFEEIEGRIADHDEQIEAIFEAIRQLMAPPKKERKKIGFEVKEKRASYGKKGKSN
ncbi:MAG: ORF6N domain-containing protein [Desulfatiglandaceae bacterium]